MPKAVWTMRCPVLDRVELAARTYADRTAVVAGGAGTGKAREELTYAELWQAVGNVADALRDRFPAGSAVAVTTRGGVGLPSAFLGVRAAGLVPFLVDAYLPRARARALLEIVRPAAVIEEGAPEVVSPGDPHPAVLPEGAGYLVFTSGSQGTPKGIVGSAAGLAAFLDWEAAELGLAPGHRAASLTSPSFDVVLREVLLPLVCGGRVHMAGARVRTNPRAVLGWLRDERIDLVHLVPSISARWLAAADGTVLPDLRWSVFAGEPLFARHVRQWRQAAPASRIGNLYGPSETTLAKFWYPVTDQAGELPDGPLPVGRPLPGTVLHRLPVPAEAAAVPGTFRIGIRTPHGSFGYLRPERIGPAAAALRRADGMTVFDTQDRGRLLADGALLVTGRLDSVVKRRGAAVDTAAITAAALRDPTVGAACCFQADWQAEGELVLALESAPDTDRDAVIGALRTALGAEMPDVVLGCPQLPRLPSGKVDARSVAHDVAAGGPGFVTMYGRRPANRDMTKERTHAR
ncbi:AMP-binding protein [Actinacidiphila sp. bgisy144]|uniref:AMP-binding protein n=1 Tax=Actinacidiphila sp. bgisy144 TaxID=3413791 RepID=UPI003EB7A67B